MKKLVVFAIILVLLGVAFIYFILNAFENYPSTFVVRSHRFDKNNEFFVDGEKVGDHKGGCVTVRTKDSAFEAILQNQDKKERISFKIVGWDDIKERSGDNLGLEIVRVNSHPELRKKYNCEL